MDKKSLIISAIVIIFTALFLFILVSLGFSISVMEIISVVFSEIAIIVSIFTFSRMQKTSTMPVLVFVHRFQKTWQIQNIGNGPAITSIIGDRIRDGKWNIVCYFPIAAGASLDLDLSENKTDFGVVYKDIKGNTYSSRCINNINEFFETNIFPEWKTYMTEWRVKEIHNEIKKYL
jgi:hypothetical protein